MQRQTLGHLALAIALSATLSAQGQKPRQESHGRLFPPTDLGLLEAPDRADWQHPDEVMDNLGIAEASVVADIGAGAGWFTIRMARRVGPNGVVYAEDVQQEMLTAISRRAMAEGLTNVQADPGQRKRPRSACGSGRGADGGRVSRGRRIALRCCEISRARCGPAAASA